VFIANLHARKRKEHKEIFILQLRAIKQNNSEFRKYIFLFVSGDKWHTRRKILTPTFHFNILHQFIDILIEEGNRMTETLKDVKGTTEKELVSFLTEHTLNAICGKPNAVLYLLIAHSTSIF